MFDSKLELSYTTFSERGEVIKMHNHFFIYRNYEVIMLLFSNFSINICKQSKYFNVQVEFFSMLSFAFASRKPYIYIYIYI